METGIALEVASLGAEVITRPYHQYRQGLRNDEVIEKLDQDIQSLKSTLAGSSLSNEVKASLEKELTEATSYIERYKNPSWTKWFMKGTRTDQVSQNTESHEENVQSAVLNTLFKVALNLTKSVTELNQLTTESQANLAKISESLNILKQDMKKVDEQAVVAKLKQKVEEYVLSDKEQAFYTPLDGKFLNSNTEVSFPLYGKVLEFIADSDKQSLPIIGDAGTGKTQFSEHITACLLKEKEDLITIYIRLSNPFIIDPASNLIAENLIKMYGLTDIEAKYIIELGKTTQKFCFIFDGVDELLLKNKEYRQFTSTNNIFGNFYHVHCIFMSRPKISGMSDEELQSVFHPIDHYGKGNSENISQSLLLQPFSDEAKNIYIRTFIRIKYKNETVSEELIKQYRDRIKTISMDEIIGKPILLMMTMSVLNYLELYYHEKGECDIDTQSRQQDLYDMYVFKLFVRARDEKPRPNKADGKSVIQDYLGYSIKLAKKMHENKDTSVIYFTDNDTFELAPSTTVSEANLIDHSHQYDAFFCEYYNQTVFKQGESDYHAYRVGFQGCSELLTIRPLGSMDTASSTLTISGYEYSFCHDVFIDYLCTMHPKRFLTGRRQQIQEFIDQQIQREKTDKVSANSLLESGFLNGSSNMMPSSQQVNNNVNTI